MLSNKMKVIREYWEERVRKLKGEGVECPYNDPTLDWRDPYYMKKPFGNTPEELKQIGENMSKALDKKEQNE